MTVACVVPCGSISSVLTSEIAELEGVQHAAAMFEVTTRSADGQGGSLLVLDVDFLGDTFFLPFAQDDEQRVGDSSVSEWIDGAVPGDARAG